MIDDVVRLLKTQFGDEWTRDEEANLRFSIDVERILREVEGAHLIGEPEFSGGSIQLTMWVDHPIGDLMTADEIAYEIFGRISEEIFFAERRFEAKTINYPFVTGSPRHGHVGALVLSGPHAAEFADRHQLRLMGGVRFQA